MSLIRNIFGEIRHLVFLIFVSAITLSLFSYSIFGKEVSIDEVRILAESLGLWLPISFIVLYSILAIFIPTTPLMALAGILFGFKHGLLYTIIAGFLSALFTFFIARFLGKDFVDNLLKGRFLSKLDTYNEKIAKRGILTVIILRMTPIMPFNILNLLMGISKVSTADYLIGTVIGLAPSNVLAVYFGGLIFKIITGRVASAFLATFIFSTAVFVFYKNRRNV